MTTITVDRDAADAEGTFGAQVAALRPDVVIDLICFTAASAQQLVDALRPSRPLLVHCGTIWVHGPALRVPVTEDEPRTAYGEYGTGKAEIEALLHRETRAGGVPSVVLHPGHISGPGWPVITPAGNLDASGLDAAGDRPAAGAARSRAGRAEPRARRRRGAGVRARAVRPAAHRGQLPRGGRAGDDAARPGGRAPRAGSAASRCWSSSTGRSSAAGPGPSMPRPPASTPSAASPRASPGPGRCSATRRGTARSEALHEALAWLVADGQADVGGQPFHLTA